MTSLEFLEEEVPTLVARLQAHDKPEWGKMSPQHMLEHLGGVFRLSASYRDVPLEVPPEKVPEMRKMLFSGEFPKNLHNPAVPQTPAPLRFASFEVARTKFVESMEKALKFLRSSPEKLPNHPVGGVLTAEEWIRFHANHVRHHFRQFGLLE